MPKFTPLSNTKHANLRIKAPAHYKEFINVSALPVYAFEAAKLGLEYPLAFIKNEENFSLVLACSLSEKLPSAWVSKEGEWVANYVPVVISKRPFTVLPSDKGEGVLCIDEESAQIGDEGELLFNEDGSITEFLAARTKLLEFLYRNGAKTEKIVSMLQEFKLFVPWEFSVAEPDAPPRDVNGLYAVDEQKLNDLSDENWLELKNQGAIPTIYAHLLSTRNLNKLLQGVIDRVTLDRQLSKLDSSLEGLFGEESETLDFDNL